VNEGGREPVRGLPGPLPKGEQLLWQGAPRWRSLARRAFHVRKIAVYCGVLLAWHVVASLRDGFTPVATVVSALWLLPLVLAAVGLPALLAWLTCRTTVYTITSRRIVMRYGIALPMTLNLPFKRIASAEVRVYADGTGDLPLSLIEPDRIGYLHLWPHARPWRITRTQPMLRSVPEARRVADILARALEAAQPAQETVPPALGSKQLARAAA
jgi:hypothetical protein